MTAIKEGGVYVSPDGIYRRVLACEDDGSLLAVRVEWERATWVTQGEWHVVSTGALLLVENATK